LKLDALLTGKKSMNYRLHLPIGRQWHRFYAFLIGYEAFFLFLIRMAMMLIATTAAITGTISQ
jgi:hypothetical protein